MSDSMMIKPGAMEPGCPTAQGALSMNPRAMTREEMLSRAGELAPRLRERAERCELGRQAPSETVNEMKELGLLRLLQPRRHGGWELGWDVFCEVTQILARGCGSQAWVYRVLGDHAQMLGTFPGEAQADVWGADEDTQMSSSLAPVGVAIPAPGGYRYSGRHSYSSGIDHASWVICGGIIRDNPEKGGKMAFFLVPKSAGEVVDDWFVTGLEGSGSKSFNVEDTFVPAHRVLDARASTSGAGPGRLVNTAPVYGLPRLGYTTSAFSALLVGMAESLLDDWLEYTATRRAWGEPVARQESTHAVAGEAASEIAAASHLYLAAIRDAMRRLEAEGSLPPELASVVTGHVGYACQLAVSAANRLGASIGGRTVYRGNHIERQYRNILAGSRHIAINWPMSAARHGVKLLRDHGADTGPERALF